MNKLKKIIIRYFFCGTEEEYEEGKPIFTEEAKINTKKPHQKALEEYISKYKETINGSMCFFGSWFGKPLDNWHRLISYETQDDYVLMRFNEEETLEVWEPKGLTFNGYFIIQYATRVRWEWFYYGRPHLPENRFFIEHSLIGDSIKTTTNVDWAEGYYKTSISAPAVLIR